MLCAKMVKHAVKRSSLAPCVSVILLQANKVVLYFTPHLKCSEINDQLNLTPYDAIKHLQLSAGVTLSTASAGANVFSSGNR